MSTARHPVLQSLYHAFGQNPELYKKCVESSKRHSNAREVNRIFDDFPELLPVEEKKTLATQFLQILKSADRDLANEPESSDLIDLSESTQMKLKSWEAYIAGLGCELLIRDSQVNPELLRLMQWDRFLKPIDVCELLCAYIGKVNLEVMSDPSLRQYINTHSRAFTAACDFINHNYRALAIDTISEAGHNYDAPQRILMTPPKPVLTTAEKTIIGAGVAGAALLGAASLGLAMFAAQQESKHGHSSAPQPPRHRR